MAKFECPGCGNVIHLQMPKRNQDYICPGCKDTTLVRQGK